MQTILIYLRRLFSKWVEMVTGGLIAVFLAVQPYTGIPAPHKWIFWTMLVGAWAIASYRVWRDAYRVAEEQQRQITQSASSESARVRIVVKWHCTTDAAQPSLQLMARNIGRASLHDFTMRGLQLGLWSVEFSRIDSLEPDVDIELVATVHGGMATRGDNDLLDVLMTAWTDIAPKEYQLFAHVIKANGQSRVLRFTLTYAPLHNPRRISDASDIERCVTIDQVSAG